MRLGVPVSIDSDVNLVTLAEHWFGQARDLDDFLVVSVEHSLGLGIMHNGELFRGANGLSPDLGDLIVRHLPGRGRTGDTPRSVLSADAALSAAMRGDGARLKRRCRRGQRCRGLRGRRRGARHRHRQPHHAVRAAEGDPRRRAPWRWASTLIGPLRASGGGLHAAEPRRRLGHRRPRVGRRESGRAAPRP